MEIKGRCNITGPLSAGAIDGSSLFVGNYSFPQIGGTENQILKFNNVGDLIVADNIPVADTFEELTIGPKDDRNQDVFLNIKVNANSRADPILNFQIGPQINFTCGVDNSDQNSFKISASSQLGVDDKIKIRSNAGLLEVRSNGVYFNGNKLAFE